MRLFKAFLTGITGLFIIITLFSLLIPFNVKVSRVVLINSTNSAEIYSQIANFDNWKNWHPVFTIDSGSIYWYPPVKVGKVPICRIVHRGKAVIIKLLSADSTSIKFLLQAEGENDIENDIVITPLISRRAVSVEWKAITRLHWYPWEKFYGIFIDKLTGPGYEDALNGLKDFIEKSPRYSKERT
ncbi:MAG: hypothetical protein ABI760_21970 [Ferruginibacter sp.]